MKLYDKKGYLNMTEIIETGYPFIFIAAARGTGKTYGGLKYFYQKKKKIIHLRRTQKESDLQNTEAGSSYKSIMNDLGESYTISSANNVGRVMDQNGNVIAFNMALNTFASVRGMDFSDIDHIFYDEFIAEPHVRKIKQEGFSLANLYESVNRNRELDGKDPLQLVCAANSVNMANDVFLYFDLITHAEQMLSKGEDFRIIGNKLLIIPQHSPISEKKKETALYKAVNSEFSDMAIKNKFILNDFSYVRKRELREYRCLLQLGDLYVYEHKNDQTFYVTFSRGETRDKYTNGYADRIRARRSLNRLVNYYLDGLVYFESFRCVALFEKYFEI